MLESQEVNFFDDTKRCVNETFFRLVRIRFEKKVSERRKNEKHTFEILIWVKKLQEKNKKNRVRARGGDW